MGSIDVARAMIEATKRKALDDLTAMFSDDAVFSQPFSTRGPNLHYCGKNEIRQAFHEIFQFFECLAYENPSYTQPADGKTIFLEVQGNMSLAEIGYEYKNFHVFRLDFDGNNNILIFT